MADVDLIPIVEAPATVVLPDAPETHEEGLALDRASQRAIAERSAPTTSEEQDRTTASQRTINLIWENTQMKVALSVIWSSLGVSAGLSIFGKWLGTPDMQLAAIVFLFGVANLVTGFYFGRTNHTRSGGVGGEKAGAR